MAQALATTVKRETAIEDKAEDDDLVKLWWAEIKRAERASEKWLSLGKKIIKRYRDNDNIMEDDRQNGARPRYNILYSNTETLRPALYAKPPKAVVARRYLDKDPVGRIASRILQRSLQYQIDAGELDTTMRACVQDFLLPGRGQAWVRYYPEIESGQTDEGDSSDEDEEDIDEDEGDPSPEPESLEKIKSETVCVDYVNYVDFLCDPARTWDEVTWVARRVYMSKDEVKGRFKGVDVQKMSFNNGPGEQQDSFKAQTGGVYDEVRKAAIWEIWHKPKHKIIWISQGYPEALDEQDDPLHLKDFFPCPPPLSSMLTTNSMIPVPFYAQYQWQAEEMDELTGRIDAMIAAVRVTGVYDMSVTELARIFQEARDTQLIPVTNWLPFSQQGGLKGAMDILDVSPFVAAIKELYEARDKCKQDINEISGVADIIRGQGDPDETATGVNTKGKFASLRLRDMQNEVARFARDIIRIMAEILAGQFQPETLEEMSSAQEMDDLTVEVPAGPPPGMEAPGGPTPGMGAPPAAPPMMQPQQPPAPQIASTPDEVQQRMRHADEMHQMVLGAIADKMARDKQPKRIERDANGKISAIH